MKGFASMVEIAHFQTPLAIALISGKGTDVIKVNVYTCNILQHAEN